MRIRDGPAAVRGDAPLPRATGASREGGGRGSPESEDLPVAVNEGRRSRLKLGTGFRQLLAEGGFVFRRSLVLLAAFIAVFVFAAAALAARVHVRVEGKTQTIFGTSEPTLNVKANALDALEAASFAGIVAKSAVNRSNPSIFSVR